MKPCTTEQAARAVKISRATLQAWIASGKIEPPGVQLVGGKAVRLWKAAELDRLRTLKAVLYGRGRGPKLKGRRRGNEDRLISFHSRRELAATVRRMLGLTARELQNGAGLDARLCALLGRATREFWAIRAVGDAAQGTTTGEPPPIDLYDLIRESMGVREFLRRVKEKYDVDKE
jgi:Helix-turn-helix domain